MWIDHRRPQFGEHNLFFLALLGLAALGAKLDELLEAYGTTPAPAPLDLDAIERDDVLCAVVGLVAARRRLQELLEDARIAPPASDPGSPPRAHADASPGAHDASARILR